MTDLEFWQTVLREMHIAYALLDAGQHIVTHDALFAVWLPAEDAGLIGQHVFDLLPEFFGQDICAGCAGSAASPAVRVENVNRLLPTGETRYLNLILLPCSEDFGAAFLVLVADVTEQGRYMQELMQGRNDLRLLRHEMARLNEQLDFLLRHYVSPDVAEALVKGTLRPELGGELREVSILFADARDFTAIVETIPAERVMTILNDYLGVIVDAIDHYGGTINQFQGDNVMAIFNAHNDQPDHAVRAVRAGISIQQQLFAYQAQRPETERWFHFGVGIDTGLAIVGNSGSRWRYTYTAIGNTTNLAARITAAVPAYEVWISQNTLDQLDGTFQVTPLSPIYFKGKDRPMTPFRVETSLSPHG
jgi:adenylate cyclase